MLAKVFTILSAWFVLSIMGGLLAGRILSPFRTAPAPGSFPALEPVLKAAAPREVEENMLELTHARMDEVAR